MFAIFKRKSVSLIILMFYSILINAGAACIWPLTSIYIHNYLHQSLTMAGMVILFMSIFMILGNYIGGYLFDNWSPYKTSIIFILISTISIVALIFFHGWPTYGLLMVPLGLGDGANLTLVNSYAAVYVQRDSRYIFNIMYVGLNLGMVVGTAMAGYLLKGGISLLFEVTTAFYIATLLLTIFYFNVGGPKRSRSQRHRSVKATTGNGHNALLFLICFMVLWIYISYSIWESVLPVRMTELGISVVKYSWIWVVNGLMIVAGQAWFNRIFGRMQIAYQIALGVFIFAVTFYALIPARHFPIFMGIIIVLTIGEMIGLPNVPAWVDNLAPAGKQGRYQAYFNVFMSTGRALGPVLGGLLVSSLTYGFLFGLAATATLIALGLVLLEVKRVHRRESGSEIDD